MRIYQLKTASITGFEELREWRTDDGGRHFLFRNEGEGYENYLVNRIPYYGDINPSPSVFYGIVKNETGESGKMVSRRVPPTFEKLKELLAPESEEFSADKAEIAPPPPELKKETQPMFPGFGGVHPSRIAGTEWTQGQVFCQDGACYDIEKLQDITADNQEQRIKLQGVESALFENAWGDDENPLSPMMVLENPTASKENMKHMARIRTANLEKPVLVRWDGQLVDGYHRLARAFLEGKKRITAVCVQKEQMEQALIRESQRKETRRKE